jgi:hypothetical protein
MLIWAILAAILMRLLLPIMRRSGNPFVRLLSRERGVAPTGPDGRWSRRDRLRAAALCAAGVGGLWGLALAAFAIGERLAAAPSGSVLMGIGFLSAILGMMAAVMLVAHLVRAPFAS